MNAAGSSKAGATDEEIADLPNWRTSAHYSEAERLAFELADATIQTPVDVSDDLFSRLQRHYGTEALVELSAICALENFRSRFNRVFRVEPNGFYCPVPKPAVKTGA
ncbi:MAG TPA: carboxymuconolactone decarboxylase family protein [Chloroflexota bacterium]|jgi:alkylhydroperoxidase family enzyme